MVGGAASAAIDSAVDDPAIDSARTTPTISRLFPGIDLS